MSDFWRLNRSEGLVITFRKYRQGIIFCAKGQNCFVMEATALIRLLNKHQQQGFDALYKSYSDRIFDYIYHIVNDHGLAIKLLNETFSKIRQETPVINHNTGSVFTWLIEETIQVILENCPEKHGEVRKQIICETQLLNITEAGSDGFFSIQHLISSTDDFLRRSA